MTSNKCYKKTIRDCHSERSEESKNNEEEKIGAVKNSLSLWGGLGIFSSPQTKKATPNGVAFQY